MVLVEQIEVKQLRGLAGQGSNPVKDTVGDSDSIIENIIIVHPNIISPDDPDGMGQMVGMQPLTLLNV